LEGYFAPARQRQVQRIGVRQLAQHRLLDRTALAKRSVPRCRMSWSFRCATMSCGSAAQCNAHDRSCAGASPEPSGHRGCVLAAPRPPRCENDGPVRGDRVVIQINAREPAVPGFPRASALACVPFAEHGGLGAVEGRAGNPVVFDAAAGQEGHYDRAAALVPVWRQFGADHRDAQIAGGKGHPRAIPGSVLMCM
jgi:hypothetical protein